MSYSLKAIQDSQWDVKKARHLLNRAGFGSPNTKIAELAKLSCKDAVESFLNVEKVAEKDQGPGKLPDILDFREMRMMEKEKNQDEIQQMRKDQREAEKEAVEKMVLWWLKRMKETPNPLREKMALFFHGHFAVSAVKVQSAQINFDLNESFRKNSLGNFKSLTTEVVKSPAMLMYLDNTQNRQGHPNENLARELFELFTLGRGNYTEQDILEAARALTGWHQHAGKFHENLPAHDRGQKTIFGKTGKYDGYALIDLIFDQKASAEFLSHKLWEYFVYENPEEGLVKELANCFRGAKYELKPLLRKIFLSEEFYSTKALGTQIKSPVQLVVNLMEDLNLEFNQPRMAMMALAGMGQSLFFPPNVKGWPGNRDWINTNALVNRYNIAGAPVIGGSFRRDNDRKRKNFKPVFDPEPFFKPHDGKTLGEVVQFAANHFLCVALEKDQKALLVDCLSPSSKEDEVFDIKKLGIGKLGGLVHLITSMAEYQLC